VIIFYVFLKFYIYHKGGETMVLFKSCICDLD